MNNRARHFLLLLMAIFIAYPIACKAQINTGLSDVFSQEPEFLPVEQAFQLDYSQSGDKLHVTFAIAEGYYLYQKQFKVVSKNAQLGEPSFPPAQQIEDEFFGTSNVFYNEVTFTIPVNSASQDDSVKLRYQGCAEAGLCYPPTTAVIYLNAVGQQSAVDSTAEVSGQPDAQLSSSQPASQPASQSAQFDLADQLANKDNMAVTLLLFLGLGIGLAFTPCVFPMYPILSSIVIGHGKQIKASRAFSLSFVYVQGMAITYSILGLVVASAGVQFQAALQHPAILGVFIVLFVALAVAMFGAYEIQLPSAWQERLNQLSNNQKQGNMVGVFIMGVLSGLVASPCTTAPLTGILLFIAQTGDMLLGFVALYILSLGMGIPLILFGMTGGKLLPKAGNWMNRVKVTFGFMMLAVAIIFIERLWVSEYSLLLWSLLGLSAFTYYYVANQTTPPTMAKGVRSLVIFLGLFGSAMLGYNTLFTATSEHQAGVASSTASHPDFMVVKNLADFEQKLAAANSQGKTVMVDLYADWCVACKEFEKYTFPDPQVVAALNNSVWMQIDLTDNTPTNLAFQQAFDVKGLPTILFFNQQGEEISNARVVGFMNASEFSAHVRAHVNK